MSVRIEYGDLVFRAVIDPSSETKLIADVVSAGKKAEKGATINIKPVIDKSGLKDLDSFRDRLARIQAEYRKTGGDGRKTALELRELAEAIERQRAALPATSNLFRAYDKTLTQTYSAANRLDGTLDRLSLRFSVGQNLVRGATSQLSRFGAVGDLAGDTMSLLATGATGLSAGAIAATAGVGLLTVGLVALDKVGNANFKQLEESTDFLAVNGVENIGIFVQSLRDLQDESRLAATFTTGQLANAAQEIVRANRSEAESLDILRNSITFAVSEKKDLALVGLELSTVMRQFNIDTSQAGEVANKFAQAGNLAKVGASEFLEGIANAGDQLAAFGFTLDEGLALLIEMDNKGFSPADKGARALSGALSAIGSPTKKALGVFKDLGITTSNVRERFIQLIEILANSKDGATKLQDAFDDNGESIEFLGQIVDNFVERGLFKLSKEGFVELTGRIGDADDAMGLLTEAMSDNRAIAAGGLKTAMVELGTVVSTALNPIITGTYNILTDILNTATDILNLTNTAGGKKARLAFVDEQIDNYTRFTESPNLFDKGLSLFGADDVARKRLEEFKLEREKLVKDIKEILGDELFPSGQDLGTSYENTNLGFEPLQFVDDETLGKVKELNAEISNLVAEANSTNDNNAKAKIQERITLLEEEIGLLQGSAGLIDVQVFNTPKEYADRIAFLEAEKELLSDAGVIAQKNAEIERLNAARNKLLGIEEKEKKSGSGKKTIYDELAEGTQKYRDALSDLVKGRELGAFNNENEILEAKLKANNQYIELLYTNFEFLSEAEKGYLQNALALNDVLEQRKIELENIEALQDTFDDLSKAGTQANNEAAFFGTLEAKLDAAQTRVKDFQKALREALANPVSTPAQLEYLRSRLEIEEGIVDKLEAQLEIANRLEENKFFTRDPNVEIDPITGQLRNYNQDALDRSGAATNNRIDARNQLQETLKGIEESREQFEQENQLWRDIHFIDDIEIWDLGQENRRKAAESLKETLQRIEDTRSEFEQENQLWRDIHLISDIEIWELGQNNRREGIAKLEEDFDRIKSLRSDFEVENKLWRQINFISPLEVEEAEKGLPELLAEGTNAYIERYEALEQFGLITNGELVSALEEQKTKLDEQQDKLREGSEGWLLLAAAIQVVVDKLKEVKPPTELITRDSFTNGILITKDPRDTKPPPKTPETYIDRLQDAFVAVDSKVLAFSGNLDLLGTGFDANALKADAVLAEINKMLAQGFDPQDEAVRNLIEDYKELTKEQRELSEAMTNLKNATDVVNGLQSFADGIKNREENPLGVVQGFGDALSSGVNLIPGIGPIASQFIQQGTSFVTGFVGLIESIFDPTKEQRESLAAAISDSMKSGMQSAISSFRNGEITLAELEIALKNSVYDSLFNASLDAFIDSAFQAAGLAPLIEEVAKAVISGNDAAIDDAFAKFDAFLNSPEFQRFIDGAARLGKSFPRITNNPDDPKALQPTLVAPLQSVDAGIDFSPIIQGFKDFGISARIQRETAIKMDKAIDRLLSAPVGSGRDGRALARSNA